MSLLKETIQSHYLVALSKQLLISIKDKSLRRILRAGFYNFS